MRAAALAIWLVLAAWTRPAAAIEPPASAPGVADPRLVLSTDGSMLSGGSGGGGGSATWLGNFGSGATLGAGAEYQQIANAHWALGTVSGAVGLGRIPAASHLYAELHEGSGDIGPRAFHYSLVLGGLQSEIAPGLSMQLEERRIDIDTSHGNLPKLGLSYRATLQALLSVSYAHSLGGNLGTRLTSARLDYYWRQFSTITGVTWGPAAPAVFDLLTQTVRPGPSLREGFLGASTSLGHTDWLLLGDYQDVAGTRRTTLTLMCTMHLGAAGQTR